jgi:6-phosphogluconolactonase
MRYLAIDHGQKRTGLALCDAGETVVSPLRVLEGGGDLIAQIREAVAEYQAEALVIGLPYNMDGTEGPRAADVRRFAEALKKAVGLPVEFFDERLSSYEAEGKLAGRDLTRKGKKKRIDAMAAAAILQGFLDAGKQPARPMPRVIREPDSEALARRTVKEFLAYAAESIAIRRRFCVALSGGRTPKRFYELLAASAEGKRLDWSVAHIFWADERAVGPTDSESNYRLAAETFLKTLPVPAGNVHRMAGEANDLNQAARDYERTLREVLDGPAGQVPQLDLIMLGMGADGHIASLMPGSEIFGESRSLVRAAAAEKGGPARLTLTMPVITAARKILVLVSGREKAPMLASILGGGREERIYPAQWLWPVMERVVWIADAQAAEGLLG